MGKGDGGNIRLKQIFPPSPFLFRRPSPFLFYLFLFVAWRRRGGIKPSRRHAATTLGGARAAGRQCACDSAPCFSKWSRIAGYAQQQQEMDDADSRLESRIEPICDPLRLGEKS
ncbi:MAG: hypothetical protein JSS42_03955 [Proteobacteria bacterium]|uniref:hypothetical protein n=1 Tax=Rudaea sp. TaxID=2136325 RepID=UPI00321F6EC2|nr:hypothetical protein [Pseudomonadota bacterium]